jgi:hypothetical protein
VLSRSTAEPVAQKRAPKLTLSVSIGSGCARARLSPSRCREWSRREQRLTTDATRSLYMSFGNVPPLAKTNRTSGASRFGASAARCSDQPQRLATIDHPANVSGGAMRDRDVNRDSRPARQSTIRPSRTSLGPHGRNRGRPFSDFVPKKSLALWQPP